MFFTVARFKCCPEMTMIIALKTGGIFQSGNWHIHSRSKNSIVYVSPSDQQVTNIENIPLGAFTADDGTSYLYWHDTTNTWRVCDHFNKLYGYSVIILPIIQCDEVYYDFE